MNNNTQEFPLNFINHSTSTSGRKVPENTAIFKYRGRSWAQYSTLRDDRRWNSELKPRMKPINLSTLQHIFSISLTEEISQVSIKPRSQTVI